MVNAPEATNTLILVLRNCPTAACAPIFAALRPHFERQGPLRCWAPLNGLGRALAVFAGDAEAADAKRALDRSLVEERAPDSSSVGEPALLRVYAGPRTPEKLLRPHDDVHLPVPVTDKNFLISPPGSPPVGWEQIREDPPNVDTLADDLIRALHSLSVGRVDDAAMEEPQADNSPRSQPASPRVRSPRDTLIIAPSSDDSLPSVFVSNVDVDADDADDAAGNGVTLAGFPHGLRRTPTPRPDFPRATVESMRGAPALMHTSRPPLAGY